MTKSLTAAELVKLAKRVAEIYVCQARRRPDYTGFILHVWPNHETRLGTAESYAGYVLSATLTPEVLASEEALTRALLASATEIIPVVMGWLARIPGLVVGPYDAPQQARDTLLGALLSEAPQ